MAETVELKDLAGKHVLSGVDFSEQSIEAEWGDRFENCQVMNFVLDDKAYSAIEDPNDGYRSAMRELRIISPELVSNRFPAIEVLAIYRDKSGWNQADMLDVYDIANTKMVLSVGTENTDDYYPRFIAEFTPENMSTNDAVAGG